MSDGEAVTACLLIIGNEILSGRTHDKNLPEIATRLNGVGVQLREARVIPDVEATIVDTLNDCRARFDYVFTTGGIGPTHDDITAECVAKAFRLGLEPNPEAVAILTAYYPAGELTEARMKMANTPVGATLIDNPVSAAPGFRVENVFVMAGVPRIMQAMLDSILPTLQGGATVVSRTLAVPLPESRMAPGLGEIQDRYKDTDIGSYPRYVQGQFATAVVVRGPDPARVDAAIEEVRALMRGLGGDPEEEG